MIPHETFSSVMRMSLKRYMQRLVHDELKLATLAGDRQLPSLAGLKLLLLETQSPDENRRDHDSQAEPHSPTSAVSSGAPFVGEIDR